MSRTLLTVDDYKAAFADRAEAARIKAECERIWRESPQPMHTAGARAVWSADGLNLVAKAGGQCAPGPGAGAAWFREKVSRHWGPPAPSGADYGSPACPKWLRERFRRDCPNNAAALIAGYGKTDSLAGRSREYIEALQAPSLPGLMSAERQAPAPIAAPAIDPAAMADEALEIAAAPILADVARELAEYVANVRADQEDDAAREAARPAPEAAAPAPGPIAAPEPTKPASDRRRPRARRSRDMAPPTIWQARALGLADPVKKPRPARASWSR